ncbi:lipin Ned1 [Binucleata daphniae]
MNPNMISGSCDVIVTKSSDGILKCTPFYVRFGKKDIFKLKDHHRVSLFVNGECIPMAIKINKLGSIVFEKDDDEETVEKIYENREERCEDIMKKYNIDLARLVWMKEAKNRERDMHKEVTKKNKDMNKTQNEYAESIESTLQKLELESSSNKNDYSEEEQRIDNNLILNTDAEVIENALLMSSNVSPKKSNNCETKQTNKKNGNAMRKTKYGKTYKNNMESNKFDSESSKTYQNRLSNESFDLVINKKAFKQIIDSKIEKKTKFLLFVKKCFDFEVFYNIRDKNRAFRRYFLVKPPTFYEELSSKQNTFKNMLNSNAHLDFLINSPKELLHLLLGVIFPKKDVTKCNLGSQDGCCSAQITFSQCMKQKIAKGKYRCVFEEFRLRSLENTQNLIVCIKGCEKCNYEFYLFYDLFVDFFFYLRNLIVTDCKSKKNKFESYVEKKINERRGYSFFRKVYKKTEPQISIQMSDLQLKRLNLVEGKNDLVFKVDGTIQSMCISCYLWNDTDKIIVSDIDGTITKSDAWGHVCAFMGKDWTHYGIAELFTRIEKNKYRFIYLSSRPIEQIAVTKKYLNNILQDGYQLPKGPILLSPNGIFGAIYTELILRKPEEFKIACLKNVKSLFVDNPFFSGFGNRKTDIITYKTVGIPTNKIYTVDHKGRVLLEYSRSKTGSFMSLNAIVDNIFPAFSNSIRHEIIDWW